MLPGFTTPSGTIIPDGSGGALSAACAVEGKTPPAVLSAAAAASQRGFALPHFDVFVVVLFLWGLC